MIDSRSGKTREFPDLLRLIDERSTAFRAAVAAAPNYQATEGRTWRLSLAADGVRRTRPADETPDADASLRGTASELVLVLYGRIPIDSLKVDGDRRLFDLLVEWDPDE